MCCQMASGRQHRVSVRRAAWGRSEVTPASPRSGAPRACSSPAMLRGGHGTCGPPPGPTSAGSLGRITSSWSSCGLVPPARRRTRADVDVHGPPVALSHAHSACCDSLGRRSPLRRDVGGIAGDVTRLAGPADGDVAGAAPVSADDGEWPRPQRTDPLEHLDELVGGPEAMSRPPVHELVRGEVGRQVTHAGRPGGRSSPWPAAEGSCGPGDRSQRCSRRPGRRRRRLRR